MTSKDTASKQAFQLLGGEARTRAAMAFVPDPEAPVSVNQLTAAAGRPGISFFDSLNQLRWGGLLNTSNPAARGLMLFTRVEHPMWAVYESAKIAMAEMGIEVHSVKEGLEAGPKLQQALTRSNPTSLQYSLRQRVPSAQLDTTHDDCSIEMLVGEVSQFGIVEARRRTTGEMVGKIGLNHTAEFGPTGIAVRGHSLDQSGQFVSPPVQELWTIIPNLPE